MKDVINNLVDRLKILKDELGKVVDEDKKKPSGPESPLEKELYRQVWTLANRIEKWQDGKTKPQDATINRSIEDAKRHLAEAHKLKDETLIKGITHLLDIMNHLKTASWNQEEKANLRNVVDAVRKEFNAKGFKTPSVFG
jgi:hypothetical protein